VYECPIACTYITAAYTTAPTGTATVEHRVRLRFSRLRPTRDRRNITKTDFVVTCPCRTVHPTLVRKEPTKTPVYETPTVAEPVYTAKETPVYRLKETAAMNQRGRRDRRGGT